MRAIGILLACTVFAATSTAAWAVGVKDNPNFGYTASGKKVRDIDKARAHHRMAKKKFHKRHKKHGNHQGNY